MGRVALIIQVGPTNIITGLLREAGGSVSLIVEGVTKQEVGVMLRRA